MRYKASFQGCWAKLARADYHLHELYELLGGLSHPSSPIRESIFVDETNHVRLTGHFNAERGYFSFRVTAFPSEALDRVGTVMGDVAHNLRVILDHLIWQFVLEKYRGIAPTDYNIVKTLYFPLTQHPSDFEQAGVLSHIYVKRRKGLAKFQPYKSWTGAYLRWLHALDRDEKHRVLTPITAVTEFIDTDPLDALRPTALDLQVRPTDGLHMDTEVMRVWVDPPNPEPDAEIETGLIPEIQIQGRADLDAPALTSPLPVFLYLRRAVIEVLMKFDPGHKEPPFRPR